MRHGISMTLAWATAFAAPACGGNSGSSDDENQCVVRYVTDSGGDGTIESIEIGTFDEYGNLLLLERKAGEEAEVAYREAFTYANAEKGQIAERAVDEGADDTIEQRTAQDWDDASRLIESAQFEADKLTSKIAWGYEGDLLVSIDEDQNGDGTLDRTQKREYDTNGNMTKLLDDRGETIFLTTFEYDTNGKLQKSIRDRDGGADGVVDNRRIRTYQEGRIVSDERYFVREQNTLVERTTYTYTATQERLDVDKMGDGDIDAVIVKTFNDKKELVAWDVDSNADGTFESRESWQYAIGRMTVYQSDTAADGTVEAKVTYTYDGEGRLTKEERLSGINGGEAQKRTLLTFDKAGLLTSVEDRDGTATVKNTYTVETDCEDRLLRLAKVPLPRVVSGYARPPFGDLVGLRTPPSTSTSAAADDE